MSRYQVISSLKTKTRVFSNNLQALLSTSQTGLKSELLHFSFPLVKYNSKAVIDFEKNLFTSLFNGILDQNRFRIVKQLSC